MKVYKFGGTSVGSPENMRSVMEIITDNEPKIVVLSAMSGTTNSLVEISDFLNKKNKYSALGAISSLEAKYRNVVTELYKQDESKEKATVVIDEHFDTIKACVNGEFTKSCENEILAQGELISTALFTILLIENSVNAALLPSLDFMRIDEDKVADLHYISKNAKRVLAEVGEKEIYITQGFICKNSEDEIDNLQRGGSDYTASLIGAAIKADEVQIWTDIDGFHNNDPRFVEKTQKIDQLSFDEAAELAYFGAKILHPLTVLPAKIENIPVRLKNTMNPSDAGTLISNNEDGTGLKAVAAKDGITAIKIRSGRMLNAYGFLRKVFEIFETYKTSIDMITTSEVCVSVTIDNTSNIDPIVDELRQYGDVEVDTDHTIVCVVGDLIAEEKGFAKNVFDALEGIPVRMISYGGSKHNVSFLIPSNQKTTALQALSRDLF